MGNLKSIEKTEESLPAAELVEFRRWFAEFDSNAWTSKSSKTPHPARFESLAAEALADLSQD